MPINNKKKELELNKKNRIGLTNISNQGCLMKIIEYNGYGDILVEFQDEYKFIQHTGFGCFLSGEVRNPYYPTVCGIGYIGNAKVAINRKATPAYETWRGMIRRCYDEKLNSRTKNKTYKDCVVCDEWLCFENFKKWYNQNYYKIDNEQMHLEKDILCKGNKVYCPECCIFAPMRINELFTKAQSKRNNLPIGVSIKKEHKIKIYSSVCSMYDKDKHLGYYDNPTDAFMAYKTFKENYIKEVADKYKDKIPQKLYDAMYRYEVEITD